MVGTNGEASYTRSEKTEIYSQPYSTRNRNVGFQGEIIGNQQKRVNRARSAELPCFDTRRESIDTRTATSGGTIAQLIRDTEEQLAASESHLSKLRNHLRKLYILREQLGEPEPE